MEQNNKIYLLEDYIYQVQRVMPGILCSDSNIELPCYVWDKIFEHHSDSIYFNLGQVWGTRKKYIDNKGHFGTILTESKEKKGSYNIIHVMDTTFNTLELNAEASDLIHEYFIPIKRNEKLKELLDE